MDMGIAITMAPRNTTKIDISIPNGLDLSRLERTSSSADCRYFDMYIFVNLLMWITITFFVLFLFINCKLID